jgi:hypothetical protein
MLTAMLRTSVDRCYKCPTMRFAFGVRAMAKISVLLTAAEEARFAAFCTERGHKKSTLIARLIREHLDQERFALQGALFGHDTPHAHSPKPRFGRTRP